ncbi:MAG: hypothetical protein ACREU4_08305, partial [Burkholderiales bacterium]
MCGSKPIAAQSKIGAHFALASVIAVPSMMFSVPAAEAAEPGLDEVVVTAVPIRKSPLEVAQPTAILT